MTQYTEISSPWGALLLTGNGVTLTGLHFSDSRRAPRPRFDWRRTPEAPLFVAVERQLREYAAARRREFDVPITFRGTPFRCAVWQAIRSIPYGQTIRYGDLAERVGNPLAVRAVAAATAWNPISIVVPCHRVVGRDGVLTGYAGGLDRKRALLALESGQAALPGMRAACAGARIAVLRFADRAR